MTDYSSAAFFSAIRRRMALALAMVTSSARAELLLKAVRGSTCGKVSEGIRWKLDRRANHVRCC